MTEKEKEKLQSFLAIKKEQYSDIVVAFLKQLEEIVKFRLIFQKASIKLCVNEPFAVIAFRRSLSYVFIEFYNSFEIDSSRIIKKIVKSQQLIIHRIAVYSLNDIDGELIIWIKNSSLFVK